MKGNFNLVSMFSFKKNYTFFIFFIFSFLFLSLFFIKPSIAQTDVCQGFQVYNDPASCNNAGNWGDRCPIPCIENSNNKWCCDLCNGYTEYITQQKCQDEGGLISPPYCSLTCTENKRLNDQRQVKQSWCCREAITPPNESPNCCVCKNPSLKVVKCFSTTDSRCEVFNDPSNQLTCSHGGYNPQRPQEPLSCDKISECSEKTSGQNNRSTLDLNLVESTHEFVIPFLNIKIPNLNFTGSPENKTPDQLKEEYAKLRTCVACGDNAHKDDPINCDEKKCTQWQYHISWIGEYLIAIYKWAVIAIAILSVIMAIIAGARWILAAGSTEKISEAKKSLVGSIGGLIFILITYQIISFINPQLVIFKPIGIQSVKKEMFPDTPETAERLSIVGQNLKKEIPCPAPGNPSDTCYKIPIKVTGHHFIGRYNSNCTISEEESKQAIRDAMEIWNNAGAKVFLKEADNNEEGIIFNYELNPESCPNAAACAPELGNIIHINTRVPSGYGDNLNWGVKDNPGCKNNNDSENYHQVWYDFLSVVAHEFGHTLGYRLQPGDPKYKADEPWHLYESLSMMGPANPRALINWDRIPICRLWGELSSGSCPSDPRGPYSE